MSGKDILKVLRDNGLTEIESKVYMFLAKNGVQNAIDVSKGMNVHKGQVYRALKVLEIRGLIEQTLESPKRFIAVPFEKVLNLIIRVKQEEANSLKENMGNLVASWRLLSIDKDDHPSAIEKLAVIEGRNNVYTRIFRMMEETTKEFLVLTTELGVIRGDLAGLLEAAINKAIEKQNICGQMLTPITKNNFKIIKQIVEKASVGKINFEWRHVNITTGLFPRFVIRDEEEVIIFMTSKENNSISSREDSGLWTNNKVFVNALKSFFKNIWDNAMNIDKRICEIEEEYRHSSTHSC